MTFHGEATMRSLSTLATLLLGLAVVFWAPAAKADCPHGGTNDHCGGAAPSTSNEFRFVGFTDEVDNGLPDTIDGGQGMLDMHALCQDDFGLDSKMCTSEEFWQSPNASAPAPTAKAWLHDKPAIGFIGTSVGINCNGWTNTSGGGPVVTSDGKPEGSNCSDLHPVTCCAPIQ